VSKLHAYLATKERMRYQKLLSVSEVTIAEEVWSHMVLAPVQLVLLSCQLALPS